LRRLGIGGAALQELRRGDLDGVSQLQELRLNANNLQRSAQPLNYSPLNYSPLNYSTRNYSPVELLHILSTSLTIKLLNLQMAVCVLDTAI